MSVLKMDSIYPIIVAVFELLMKIWQRLVIAIWAIAHPIKVIQMTEPAVVVKNVISIM